MQIQDECDGSLASIVHRLDQSVKEKFERCAKIDWCINDDDLATDSSCAKTPTLSVTGSGSQKKLHSQSKFMSKVARRLACMKRKLTKAKKVSKRLKSVASKLDDQVTKGSNTPASSRPSSIVLTMDQIENYRSKNIESQQ